MTSLKRRAVPDLRQLGLLNLNCSSAKARISPSFRLFDLSNGKKLNSAPSIPAYLSIGAIYLIYIAHNSWIGIFLAHKQIESAQKIYSRMLGGDQ